MKSPEIVAGPDTPARFAGDKPNPLCGTSGASFEAGAHDAPPLLSPAIKVGMCAM
jgi:hypothetical protein